MGGNCSWTLWSDEQDQDDELRLLALKMDFCAPPKSDLLCRDLVARTVPRDRQRS